MKKSVAEIFNIRPEQWGFRGEPYLWEEIEQAFSFIPLPCSEFYFIELFKEFFLELTNYPFEVDSIYVEKYSHGGMSSGMVSIKYWTEEAIPLLLERLEEENKLD